MDKTQEENEDRVAEEYLSSLSDLNCNSKPLINMLTMLAEENIEYAPVIVKVVEQHIAKVPPDIKLPLLYLIDSIVKNVKSTYVQLFSQCIVNIFCNVFEKVNEKIRERMYALRQTWNEVFSPQKLYALDVKVKRIDNNWPITAKQPQPSIHVNPNFLKSVGAVRGGDVEEILQAKTRELLELRKRKLELELEATKKHLEEQEKQLSKTTDGVIPPVKGLVDSSTLSGLCVQPVPSQIVPGIVAPGLMPAHHLNTSAPVGVVSGAIAQKMYHHNFRNPRPHTQPHVSPGLMAIPPLNYQPVTTVGKPKVHPVNPALLNTVRHRDPRLARQQQQQQSSNNRNMQIHSIRNDSHTEDGKVDGKSVVSFRNGNSKNSRGTSGSTDDISVVENKSSGRHSSSSSRYAGHVSKSSSSRDKEKDRKRSESKSSTTSSSSVGSSSSERRKGSSSNRNKKTAEKCDKDAFEIAPLSTAFKRKSLSPSSSPIKKKEFKRISKSQGYSQSKYHSRSRSPSDITTKDVDLRLRSSPSSSPKKHPKSSVSDSEPEEEDQNTTTTTTGLENKNVNKSSKEKIFQSIQKPILDIKIVLEPMPAIAKTDIDLRRLPSSYSPIAKQVVAPTTTCETTLATSSPKVSFKIQKLFNKLEKSTEHTARASVNVETSKVSKPAVLASEAENDAHDVIMDVSGRPVKETNDRMSEEYTDDKKRILTKSESEEPLPKKSKSAKLDALFGDEDVDLRTVMPPQILITQQQAASNAVSPPPPPVITDLQEKSGENWSKVSSSNIEKSSPKKAANLEDVRAKLAKATKYNKLGKNDKFGKDLSYRFKLDELNVSEDSQEANDEKIRTIIAQAQELLETNSINQEQYKTLIQKVMSINESSKLKEAKRRESLNNIARIKPLTDIETVSSSIDADRSAAREAILRKRIPKLPKSQQTAGESTIPEINLVANNNSNLPAYNVRNNSNDNDIGSQKTKHGKEKRSKPSKWGERVEPTHANISGMTSAANIQKGWLKGSAIKQHVGGGFRGIMPISTLPNPNIPPQQIPWQIGPNIAPSPFINPIPMAMGSVSTPPNPPNMQTVAAPPSIPKPCNSIDNPQADLVRTITIDGLSKEIRIYDQVAIVFMELDQPREIGFQIGQRSIIIDNEEPITLQFNDDYKTFPINGEPHRLRFGFPSRELYIDEHWYEIYFGGPPVSIPINNKMHILKAEGPPPQVNIGALRRDLVVGKINMIVDAHIVIPLFLDAKIQTFRLRENEHTVQFADNLLTVLLDGEVVNVEFGGLPKSYMLRGITYFIRFGALPQGVVAGKIRIKDMIYIKTEPLVEQAIEITPKLLASTTENAAQASPSIENTEVKLTPSKTEEQVSAEIQTASSTVGTGTATTSIPIIPAAALSNINIDELFQKLVSSGILSGTTPAPNKAIGVLPTTSTASVFPDESVPPVATIQPIDLSKTETIKTRQAAIVNTLFSGMQCSSCGVRFPPEQTIKYSQHLDWHFRQNRRERDSSRRAHSRKWYYDLTDWIQYEEIEDLEEREKNFFETQLNDVDTNDETSNQRWVNSPVLSCPAMPEDVDRACDMCHEKFEQFYNEELEEWHLRSAIRVDDKIYHPLCYEDYKTSLNPTVPQAKNEVAITEDDNAVEAVIKIEVDDKSEETKTSVKDYDNDNDIDEDEDDDVIMLPIEEPSVTEIDDDDEYVPVNVTREEMGDLSTDDKSEEGGITDNAGSDVEIQEPHIPFTDLDTYVEKPQSEGDESSQKSFMNIKIKEEPKDDYDDEDDGFEDVGTVLLAPEEEISIQSSEETQTQTIASSVSTASPVTDRPPSSTSLIQLDASEFSEAATAEHSTPLDGNLGTADEHNLSSVGPTPAIPLASLVNKIKINIAKNSASTNHSSSSNSTSTLATSSTTVTTSTPTSITCVNYNLNEPSTSSTDQKHAMSAITVVSTIPVLCGGGTMSATRTTIATSSSGGGSNESPNVSTISVIGSYGNSSNNSRHYMDPISVASTSHSRTPPIEDTITYELKPSLRKVVLTKAKKVECGVETSGLCSVM